MRDGTLTIRGQMPCNIGRYDHINIISIYTRHAALIQSLWYAAI